MSAGARVALLVALLVALPGVATAGQVAAGPDATRQVTTPADDAPLTMVVDVNSDGDARWTVSTTFNLTTDAERESFRSLAESFENGETSAVGLQAFRRASQEASEATGREMSIVDIQRRASPDQVIENGTGRLSVSFTWTNFGRTEGDRLFIGDAFRTGDGGTWLPGLDPGDRLVIRAPRGYGVAAARVAPQIRDNRSVLQWTGPARLNASVLGAEFTGQTGPTPTLTPADPNGSFPWPLAVTLGLGGGVVAVYLLARRRDGFDFPPTPAGETADSQSVEGATAEVGAERVADTAGADSGETAEAEEEREETPDIDEELLSDEERVERLLEQNGGRMKQANIVKETGWSNAKVSQLLSTMEEEGRVDKLRIGRENLISFPDEDVTDLEE